MKALFLSATLALPSTAEQAASAQPVYFVREVLPQEVAVLEPASPLEEAALHAPREMLILPMSTALRDGGRPSINAESSEEEVMQDGSRRAMRKMRRCQNGVCEERMEVSDVPTFGVEDELPTPFEAEPMAPLVQNLRGVMRHLAQESAFGEELGRELPAEFEASRFAQGSTLPDAIGNATSESRSVSTEMVVRNGRMVRRTTTCVNGKCTTQTVGDRAEESSKMGNATASQASAAKEGGKPEKAKAAAQAVKAESKELDKGASKSLPQNQKKKSKAIASKSVTHVL